MSDIQQDRLTGELTLVNGDFVMVDLREAILQDCKQTLNFLYGEWFLDSTKGIPYFQSVLVKAPDLIAIQGIFIDAITAVNGVMEMLSFEFSYDAPTRLLTISFQARTTDGIINVDQILGAA